MARGNVKGPLGPLMLALLLGLSVFMLFVLQSPELSERFKRPEGFYDNTFEKIGVALLFAVAASAIGVFIKRFLK